MRNLLQWTFRSSGALLLATSLAGCGGGGGSSLPAMKSVPVVHPTAKPVVPSGALKCPVKEKCIVIEIPPRKESVKAKNLHRPSFISPSTVSSKIYIIRATGTDPKYSPMLTGPLLAGYPLTEVLTRTNKNCVTDATTSYLVCTISLPGIPTDGTTLGENVILYDGQGNRLAISAVTPYLRTLTDAGVPKDFDPLVFTGNGVGDNNSALITQNGVVAAVGMVQDAPLYEGTAATVGIEFQGIDADGNVIQAPGLYSDAFGNGLRIGAYTGDYEQGIYPGHFILTQTSPNCPPGEDTVQDQEPECSNTLAYDGTVVQEPNQNLMVNQDFGTTTNILQITNQSSFANPNDNVGANTGFEANFGEFAPVVFPLETLVAPTGILAFNDTSSAAQTVSTGVPASYGGAYGTSAYGQSGWLMDEQDPYTGPNLPASCSTVAGIQNNASSFTISPLSLGSCETTGLFNEGTSGGQYQPGTGSDVYNVQNREAESYPINVGPGVQTTQSLQVTPASIVAGGPSPASGFTLSQYGVGAEQIGISEPWCASRSAIYPFVGTPHSTLARDGPTNVAPASSVASIGTMSATLVDTSSTNIPVTTSAGGGICEVDVTVNGSQAVGAAYYAGVAW